MSPELNYTGRIFWKAEVLLSNNVIHERKVTRIDLRDYLKTVPLSLKDLKDVDVINKYVVPYVHSLFENYVHDIKYIIVRKNTTI